MRTGSSASAPVVTGLDSPPSSKKRGRDDSMSADELKELLNVAKKFKKDMDDYEKKLDDLNKETDKLRTVVKVCAATTGGAVGYAGGLALALTPPGLVAAVAVGAGVGFTAAHATI